MTKSQRQFYLDAERSGATVYWGCLENMTEAQIDKLIELDKVKMGIK